MFNTTPVFFRWRYLSLAALISIAHPQAALVQGLDAPNAIDKIIGTDVQQNEATAVDDEDDVLGAIDKTAENINIVKTTTKLDRISIVYLSDAIPQEGGPPPLIQAKINENIEDIRVLRQELEGNAMLYHAIDSHGILMREVLAIKFDKNDRAVIFAASKPPR